MWIEWMRIEYQNVSSVINHKEIDLEADPEIVSGIVCELI